MDLLKLGSATLVLLALAGCVPDLDRDESMLEEEPRLVAIIAEPTEAAPGASIRYRAIHADRQGLREDIALDWAFCRTRKPLAELGPIARSCLSRENVDAVWLEPGSTTMGTIPTDACRLFGPELPPPLPSEPAARPVDPDITSGYRQPLILFRDGESAIYEQRVQCGLALATPVQSAEFSRRYRPNVAPRIEHFEHVAQDGTTRILTAETSLPSDRPATLRPVFAECAETDPLSDCTGAELYLRFDSQSRTLQVVREELRIAWYSAGASLRDERTGSAHEWDPTSLDNELTLESESAVVIAVVRDARGGTSVQQLRIRAE